MFGDKKYDVTIRLDPYRIFKKADLKFKYPSPMVYACDDSDPNIMTWTLEGGDSVIMVQSYDVAVDEESIVEAFKSEYLQMKAKVDIREG